MTATERFLRYVTVYTTSDESAETRPSTERQKDLGRLLLAEMETLGLQDVRMDDAGDVIGTLPANVPEEIPALALIAHMDTSPDAPGEHVCPRLVRYEGGDLCLSDSVRISAAQEPALAQYVGRELIVSDGTTLLGADDKAGIAEILTALELLIGSGRPHGTIRAVFTTDEEVGSGADGLDVDALDCRFGYTVDGGPLGEIEYENFNAASAVLHVRGVGVHPGSARGVMVNASTVGMAFHALLPPEEVPERTDGYEGFFHLHTVQGDTTAATLSYLIRDHDRKKFADKKEQFRAAAAEINRRFGPGTATVELRDSYYNMREKILPHLHLIRRAERAFRENGVEPRCVPIRGGTDGAVLSWRGLPCPNLSTGGYAFHSVREWIPAESLETMPLVLTTLAESFAEGGAE